MKDIEITFLGTGSAVPTAKKNHVGTLVSFGSENILVDCGEGVQRQFKKAEINLCKLTRVLISHWHADHTLGLPGLLETLRMSEYNKTLLILGPKGTKKNVELFEKIYGRFRINHEIKEISHGRCFENKDFYIQASPMKHIGPTNAYSIVIKDKLRLDKKKLKKLKMPSSPLIGNLQKGKDIIHPVTKKRIKAKSVIYVERGKKITIVMDTVMNENAIRIAKDSDLLISEASFTEAQKDKAREYKHLTTKDAAMIAKKAKVKKLILTHCSQRYGDDVKPIIKEAKSVFKNVLLANDFDRVSV